MIPNGKFNFLCSDWNSRIIGINWITQGQFWIFPAGIYLFKVSNRNKRTISAICSKLTIKTPEWCQWRHSGVFIINFEHIALIVLVFPLLTLSKEIPSVLLVILFTTQGFRFSDTFLVSVNKSSKVYLRL